MDHQEIIKQLLALEEYLEEGRKKAHDIRMQIESTDPPPASLQEDISEEAKLARLLGKKENGKSSNKKGSSDKTE